jgi:sigma-B regulation protein RsbQ
MGAPDQPALSDELSESFCTTDPAIARHFARVTFLSDNRRDLPEVSVPTLVIQSVDDAIAPLPVGEFVAQQIPDGRLAVIPVNGHCPHLSAPDRVTAAIREFLP